MNRLIAALLAGSAVLAAAPAFAADLPEPVPVAPIAETPLPQAFDWTGVYIGGTVGYGWGEYGVEPAGGGGGDFDSNGFLVGAFVGYNAALTQNWIVGIEADAAWLGSEDLDVGGAVGNVETSNAWLTTYRARVGYAFDNFMVYGTGGLALGFGEADFAGGSDENTHVGFAVGGGVEAALTQNITARAEYLYVDTGDKTYSAGGESADVDLDGHLVKVGVAYKF